MAARFHIIVLAQDTAAPASRPTYNVAFWLDVPTARQPFYAATGAVSRWTGALTTDNTAIATGAMVEKIILYQPDAAKTLAQIQADLQAMWTVFQNQITALNSWAHYGSVWDGVTWTMTGVA